MPRPRLVATNAHPARGPESGAAAGSSQPDEHRHIPANPARAVRNVPAAQPDEIDPLTPFELERLLTGFDGRGKAITLLGGHLGLRPLEIRQVPWTALADATLTVRRAQRKRRHDAPG